MTPATAGSTEHGSAPTTAAGRCVGYHPDATPDDPAPDATIGYLCGKCFPRLRTALIELPAVATWLEVNIAAGGSAGEKVSGTREDPIPLRTDVLDLIGPIHPNPTVEPAFARNDDNTLTDDALEQRGATSMFGELRSWAALVEEESGFAWDDRRTLIGAVGYLAGHLSWIAAQPWVDELITVIRKLHADAHRLAPWRAEVRRDPTPCETCGARAIVIYMVEGRSRCEKNRHGCGRVIVWDHREEAKTA